MPFSISMPSAQALFLEMRRGEQLLAIGTGFVVMAGEKPLLITNRHNVTGRDNDTGSCLSRTLGVPDNIRIAHNFNGSFGAFAATVEPLFEGETPRWIEHPSYKARADVVALPLTELTSVALMPFTVSSGTHNDIRCADPVHVVGFPFGLRSAASFGIWATGSVASEPEINHGGEPTFLIDCRTREGQSGSPVVSRLGFDNFWGNRDAPYVLLGIYSGRVNKDSDLGKVWKAYVIAELVAWVAAGGRN
ncbi:MAG: serine protease [Haliea sp.]|nr:MAG: serine protease [Haliea sp.]